MVGLTTDPFPKQKRAQVPERTKQLRAILKAWDITASSMSRLMVRRRDSLVGFVTDSYGMRVMTPADRYWDVLFGDIGDGECRRITKSGNNPVIEDMEAPDVESLMVERGEYEDIDLSKTKAFRYGEGRYQSKGYVFETVGGTQIAVPFERVATCYKDGEMLRGSTAPNRPVFVYSANGSVLGLMMPLSKVPTDMENGHEVEWTEVGG